MTREYEIRQAAHEIALGYKPNRGNDFYQRRDMLENMAQWVDEHPKNPWRESGLPPRRVDVKSLSIDCFIKTSKGLYFSAFYDYQFDDWYIDGYGLTKMVMERTGYIKFWMPIPEAPKGE